MSTQQGGCQHIKNRVCICQTRRAKLGKVDLTIGVCDALYKYLYLFFLLQVSLHAFVSEMSYGGKLHQQQCHTNIIKYIRTIMVLNIEHT